MRQISVPAKGDLWMGKRSPKTESKGGYQLVRGWAGTVFVEYTSLRLVNFPTSLVPQMVSTGRILPPRSAKYGDKRVIHYVTKCNLRGLQGEQERLPDSRVPQIEMKRPIFVTSSR